MFKLLLLCYKALNSAGPVYLKDMTQIAEPKRFGLPSANDVLHLERPQTRLITVGDRTFSFAAIVLWNKLPLKLKDSKTVDTFKLILKPVFSNTNLNNYMYALPDIVLIQSFIPVYCWTAFMSFINSLYFLFLTDNLCLADIRRRRTLFLVELTPVHKRLYYYYYYYYTIYCMLIVTDRTHSYYHNHLLVSSILVIAHQQVCPHTSQVLPSIQCCPATLKLLLPYS